MKRIKNKLNFKILSYLVIFSIIILFLLWFLQILSLDKYYELSVKGDINDVVDEIKNHYNDDNYEEYFNRLSFENNMCIEIYDGLSTSYSSISCYKEAAKLTKEKRDVILTNTSEKGFELLDNRMDDNKILMYGIKLEENKFGFVQVRLAPVDSTVSILKEQLFIISGVVCVLSIFGALYISKKISEPIEKINENAKKIVKGEYDVSLDNKNTIDEIRELNENLNYASNELSKTESLRRELLSNVSHDLKTPLTMIKAYAEMVRDITYKDKKKREDNLNVIIEESDRLNLLVNDILDLSKYQSNTIELEKEDFDLNLLIKEIINRYNIYKEKEEYKISYKEKKKKIVNGDRKRIEQVIYNLLNNAINYAGEKKKIDIELIEKDNTIELRITNDGEGIKEEDIPLIWDKYYKIDKTYSRTQVGTGIGLSIVKNILELHKSNYGVDSKVGEYTTFYFDLQKGKE